MGLTSEQRKVAKRIVKIGNRRGASPKEIKAALETGLVESNLTNPSGGDADSAGWRQERASLYKNPTNLKASINRFYDETGKVKAKYARAGDLAAAVQRPAAQYRGRYQQRSGEAQQLMRSLGRGGSATPATYSPATSTSTPGVDNSDTRLQLKQAYLLNRHDPNALLQLAVGLKGAGDVAGTTTVTPGKRLTQVSPVSTSGYGGKVHIAPTADRAGVPTHRNVVSFVQRVSSLYGKPLTIGTGSNHSQMTASGNVSDHWRGEAADVPLSGRALTKAGQDALIAAGMPVKQARKQKGGLYNVPQKNGRRIQIIFNSNIGGNHYNHLHVGF